MPGKPLHIGAILDEALGITPFRTARQKLEHQRLWWMSQLPNDHPLAVHLMEAGQSLEMTGVPMVPHYLGQSECLSRRATKNPRLLAPILEVGILHLRLLLQGVDVSVPRLCLLGAKGGLFAKYEPDDMDSLSVSGSDYNREIKSLMFMQAADVLLGGKSWEIPDYLDHLNNARHIGRPTPHKYQQAREYINRLPAPWGSVMAEEYATCLTHHWSHNASVWALRNHPSDPITSLSYRYPLAPAWKNLP